MKIKSITLIFLLLFGASHSKAQYAPLKIGDPVPDFEFAIQNYHSPTAKLSDFHGKLVILDFWSTGCVSCFASFPRMEKLQKQYGDKIQIILVNIRETEEEVKVKMKAKRRGSEYLDKFPSIIGNASFFELFPHPYAGNYVWIDKEGVLRLSSSLTENIYASKINDILDGKAITFVATGESYYGKEGKISLLKIINESLTERPNLGSIFTSINLDYFPAGGQALNQIDSASNTIRNTYINRTALMLYYFAIDKAVSKTWESKVFGPNLNSKRLDYFLMKVKDIARYDEYLIPDSEKTDLNMVKSYYCYEQILPINTTIEQQIKYMQEDLNRYFGLKYGMNVTIEDVKLPCYIIKKIANVPASAKAIKKQLRHLGKRDFTSVTFLESVVASFFRKLEFELPFVFDVDNEDRKREFIMPVWKKGDQLQDFQEALRLNGLDFVKGEQKVKMMVFRD